MTRVTISGNANGSGNVNFAAPNTNSAITVTLPTSNVDMDALGPSTTLADVGTYAFCRTGANFGQFLAGTTTAGSNLIYGDRSGNAQGGPGVGTWQCMGHTSSSDLETLYVRIS